MQTQTRERRVLAVLQRNLIQVALRDVLQVALRDIPRGLLAATRAVKSVLNLKKATVLILKLKKAIALNHKQKRSFAYGEVAPVFFFSIYELPSPNSFNFSRILGSVIVWVLNESFPQNCSEP